MEHAVDHVEQLFVGGGGAVFLGCRGGGVGAEDDFAVQVVVA